MPPIAILMASPLLGEVPPALAVAGGALRIGGVIVSRSRGRSWRGRRRGGLRPER